jgi:hypothetical protein
MPHPSGLALDWPQLQCQRSDDSKALTRCTLRNGQRGTGKIVGLKSPRFRGPGCPGTVPHRSPLFGAGTVQAAPLHVGGILVKPYGRNFTAAGRILCQSPVIAAGLKRTQPARPVTICRIGPCPCDAVAGGDAFIGRGTRGVVCPQAAGRAVCGRLTSSTNSERGERFLRLGVASKVLEIWFPQGPGSGRSPGTARGPFAEKVLQI